jgi:drug/metabolite transporter (DMT)-like permease
VPWFSFEVLLLSSSQLGLLAALGAASIWASASLIFSAANRLMQPSSVNLLRLLFALLMMFITNLIQTQSLLPPATSHQWLYLSLSGVIGLGLGDLALFYAFDAVGPRLAMLVAASAPVMAALLGWIFLREALTPLALVGMFITLVGISWVVLEKPETPRSNLPAQSSNNLRRGVIFGLLAAAGQAIGVLLTKHGMTQGTPLDARDAAFLRTLSASAVMLPLQALWYKRKPTNALNVSNPTRGLLLIAIGAFMGTYIGMSLSMVAARDAELGKAQTILSLPPVLILPLSYFIQKEHISLRAVLGAIVAMLGTALLFA